MARKTYEARPACVERLQGSGAGPCQVPDCGDRAIIRVEWQITGGDGEQLGRTLSWFCEQHAPELL